MSKIVTYTEFAASATSWLPDQSYGEQNAAAIEEVMTLVAQDYPHAATTVDFDPATLPPDDQRRALWTLLMGRQHNRQEVSDGKVDIATERETEYRQVLGKLALGPHSTMEPIPVDAEVDYHQALLNAGTPLENIARFRAAFANEQGGNKVRDVVMLTGQRMRGIWHDVPGERSVPDLFDTIGAELGVDMAALAARSPWVQAELARTGEGWEAPFGTEYHICRLVAEAYLADLIDWDSYEQTVATQAPIGSNEAIQYQDGDEVVTVPAREEGAVTYQLKNGQRCHIVNGAATARPQGAPRATSRSIAEEAMAYVPVPDGASIVAVSGAPHLRAAVDTLIAYLDHANKTGQRIERADVAAAPWEPRVTKLVAALGEIMAGIKADYRLRAVLRGQDPNTPELLAI